MNPEEYYVTQCQLQNTNAYELTQGPRIVNVIENTREWWLPGAQKRDNGECPSFAVRCTFAI